jgi:hypothetical protein
MTKRFTFILALFYFINTNAQTIEGAFEGSWAETVWSFEFSKDNTYKRTSDGHFGNTEVFGKYKINRDTILLTSYENTDGTISEKYLIDGDSCIIDINLKFDYCKTKPGKIENNEIIYQPMRQSRKRNIIYPQLPTNNKEKISEVENILMQIINWTELDRYFHADAIPQRKPLIIQNYFEIKSKNGLELIKFGQPVIFKSKEDIKKEDIKEFLEIKEFNIMKDYISVSIEYRIEGVSARIMFDKNKDDNTWNLSKGNSIQERRNKN